MMLELLRKLDLLGYQVDVSGENFELILRDGYDPDPDVVYPLLRELRREKEKMRQPWRCTKCGGVVFAEYPDGDKRCLACHPVSANILAGTSRVQDLEVGEHPTSSNCPSTSPDPNRPPASCYNCGSITFWRSQGGPWLCLRCVRPARPGLVSEVINEMSLAENSTCYECDNFNPANSPNPAEALGRCGRQDKARFAMASICSWFVPSNPPRLKRKGGPAGG